MKPLDSFLLKMIWGMALCVASVWLFLSAFNDSGDKAFQRLLNQWFWVLLPVITTSVVCVSLRKYELTSAVAVLGSMLTLLLAVKPALQLKKYWSDIATHRRQGVLAAAEPLRAKIGDHQGRPLIGVEYVTVLKQLNVVCSQDISVCVDLAKMGLENGALPVDSFIEEEISYLNDSRPAQRGKKPLLFHLFYGYREVFEAFLKAGANPNAADSVFGITALMVVASHRPSEYEMESMAEKLRSLKLLLQYGADKNIRDHDGKNAYDFALEADRHWRQKVKKCAQSRRKKLSILLKKMPNKF